MKRLIRWILQRLGWRLIRLEETSPPSVFGLNSFFQLLKNLGFAPRHVIDVGANHGTWTREALNFFPDAHYTLVEPQDDLKTNIQDLIGQGYKLNWINAGASDTPGTLMFTVAQSDDSSSFVPTAQDALASSCQQVPVAVRTINEIVTSSGTPAPDMVKIDAEGFDLKALAGASDLFGKTDIFLLEAVVGAAHYENTMLEVVRRMAEAKYRLMDITDLGRSPKHGVLWHCELAFVRNDSPLLSGVTSYE
jgi:FkbM family methyltransferase